MSTRAVTPLLPTPEAAVCHRSRNAGRCWTAASAALLPCLIGQSGCCEPPKAVREDDTGATRTITIENRLKVSLDAVWLVSGNAVFQCRSENQLQRPLSPGAAVSLRVRPGPIWIQAAPSKEDPVEVVSIDVPADGLTVYQVLPRKAE